MKPQLVVHFDPYKEYTSVIFTRCGMSWPLIGCAKIVDGATHISHHVVSAFLSARDKNTWPSIHYPDHEITLCQECMSHSLFQLKVLARVEL